MLNPQLLRVPLYVAGKSPEQVCEELGLAETLKLGSNENPLGPSPMALAAVCGALAEVHRYPGIAERDLRRKLAAWHGNGLGEQHLIIGNGATDILRVIAQAFIFGPVNSVVSRVTFPLYSLLTTMFGGQVISVALRPDYHMDLAAMAAAINAQTRIVWLCSPNNPTGLALAQKEIDEFIRRLPENVLVVFDEAYQDFVADPNCADSMQYVCEGRNVIVVRTFSKIAGLANLRVGYAVAAPGLIEYLSHAVPPFNTGALAVAAAAASLDDHEYHRRCQELVWRERQVLYASLSEMGLACLPSQANFILVVDPPLGAPAVVDALLHQGVIVRPMAGFGLPNAFRVTVGLPEQNERFLLALRTVLAEGLAMETDRISPAVSLNP